MALTSLNGLAGLCSMITQPAAVPTPPDKDKKPKKDKDKDK